MMDPAPDAVNTMKRAFKGLFKRGKKNKQDQETSQTQTQPATSTTNTVSTCTNSISQREKCLLSCICLLTRSIQTSQAPTSSQDPNTTTTTSAAAPQLPPDQSSSPLQSPEAEESSKPLPPTHPLATGPQSQPQEAVPINHEAEPGSPSDTARLAPVDTADLIREQNKPSQIVSDLPPRIPVDTSVPIGEQSQISTTVGASSATDGAKDDLSPAIQNSAPLALPQTTTEHIGVMSAKENEPIAAPLKTDSAVEEESKVEDKPGMPSSI